MSRHRVFFFSALLFALFNAPAFAASPPFPIPDTGQTLCYDTAGAEIPCAGTGQDGEFSINPMSYTKLSADGTELDDSATSWAMVRDNVTGLIWEVKQNNDGVKDYSNPHDADNYYTWYDTEDFINALNTDNFGGYSDWRMPSREELLSILDYSISAPSPTINSRYFLNTLSYGYWTCTNSTYYAWTVGFGGGASVTPISHINDMRVPYATDSKLLFHVLWIMEMALYRID